MIPLPNHEKLRCYAAYLGNCNGGITREHYISRSVLDIAGNVVRISGFPWQETDKVKDIGINTFVSKVLCRHHNNELSPLDESGKAFLQALKSVFNNAVGKTEFNDEAFSLEGDRIELWLLKILCGLCAVSKSVAIPKRWTNILFEREEFPQGWGLHIFGEEGGATWFFNLVRVISIPDKTGKIAGAKFGIGGLVLLLAFGKPDFSDSRVKSIYRPRGIIIEKDAKTKTLDFSWGKYSGEGSIHLNITGLIEDGLPIYKPLVGPLRKVIKDE